MTWRDSVLWGAGVERAGDASGEAWSTLACPIATHGGAIPGAPGVPAFVLHRPPACFAPNQGPNSGQAARAAPGGAGPGGDDAPLPLAAIPVVIAVPHAGRLYPPCLRQALRFPETAALRLEDRLVDLVAVAAARATGAALLVAQAPRALIDLNRASDDVDWGMIAGTSPDRAPGGDRRHQPGHRARSGLGLVPRRLPGLGELWRHPIGAADLAARIDQIHRPYHRALEQVLADLRQRWGAALLIDLHSMPPLRPRNAAAGAARSGSGHWAQYVVGDRFGAACDARLVQSALDHFERADVPHALNQPYAGGYVLDRHGRPQHGIHAFQLEICRAAYLDADLCEPGPGMGQVTELVSALVRTMADELLACGSQGLAQAAQ